MEHAWKVCVRQKRTVGSNPTSSAIFHKNRLSMDQDILNYQFIQKLKSLSFIDAIWLFGSRARGDALQRSDIDLAILCPIATEENWYQVLEIQNNADTLLKIDCVRFDQLEKEDPLRKNILRFKKIIYEKGMR